MRTENRNYEAMSTETLEALASVYKKISDIMDEIPGFESFHIGMECFEEYRIISGITRERFHQMAKEWKF